MKLYIPPMASVTDLSFRKVLRYVLGELEDQVLFATEMISGRGIHHQKNPERLKIASEEKNKVVVQLFGHEIPIMVESALQAEAAGAKIIDINMGCPAPKIIKNGDGAFLMKDPIKAQELCKEIVKVVKIPVSVKCRLGWDKNNINVLDLALRLEDIGINFLTIHGRTRSEFYLGQANHEEIAKVVKAINIPVFANGDIDSPEKAFEVLEITKAKGIAVARACIGNPWIAKEIISAFLGLPFIKPSLEEKLKIFELHLDIIFEDKGEIGVQIIKKHLKGYLKGFKDCSIWRDKFAKANSYKEMKDLFNILQNYSQDFKHS